VGANKGSFIVFLFSLFLASAANVVQHLDKDVFFIK
jgi:hypothetical protein